MMYENGVFLSRFQPIHNGHLFIINKMFKECKNIYIIIGSSNEYRTNKNPYSLDLRYDMLTEALYEYNLLDNNNVNIIDLPDIKFFNNYVNESESVDNFEWGRYLYYNIVGNIGKPVFTLYHGVKSEWNIKNWFNNDLRQRIIFSPVETKLDVSGTKVREAINNNNLKYIEDNCPRVVKDRIKVLKTMQNIDEMLKSMNYYDILNTFGVNDNES